MCVLGLMAETARTLRMMTGPHAVRQGWFCSAERAFIGSTRELAHSFGSLLADLAIIFLDTFQPADRALRLPPALRSLSTTVPSFAHSSPPSAPSPSPRQRRSAFTQVPQCPLVDTQIPGQLEIGLPAPHRPPICESTRNMYDLTSHHQVQRQTRRR